MCGEAGSSGGVGPECSPGGPYSPAAQPKMKGRSQLDRQTDPITSDFLARRTVSKKRKLT